MSSDRRMGLPRLGAAVAAGVLVGAVLTGCSSGGADKSSEGGSIEGELGLEDDGIRERQKQAEELIAPCMKRQGWDYRAVDPFAQRAELVGSRNLTEEEFNEQFGYGITTLFEKRLDQSALGPNEELYNSLSEQDKAAFDRALYGDDKTATFADALDTGDFSRLGGCLEEAAEEVFGGAQVIQDLTEKLDELDAAILEDSRMVEAVNKWSDCMAQEGYDFGAQDDVDTFLENRLEAIVGPVEEAQPPAQGEEPAWDQGDLQQLQRDEVEVVAVDIACEDEHITKVEEKVRPEYEREFRDRNSALIDRVPPA